MIPEHDIYSAIADPTRRRVIAMLAREDLPAGAVAHRIDGMSRPAVVKHLNILRRSGIVITEKQGRQRINRLNPAALQDLKAWVAEIDRFWETRLTRLKDLIESEEWSDG
ncbi:ArsR/SmtB family transcription factor [Eilatimonas milleporae]|uniref:ArsR family transcriptional regulator n=1 Tax=Eilatimonas milleporae TaxID=911205 RepID=A0A3M0CTM9_9PROT|nr:metalloregulator ArsR/SmtB family transcription factor [Eilatimonas milleporae]RMB12325.1 ArsR family transcriptional regulator [Eilatimonas milleporae]